MSVKRQPTLSRSSVEVVFRGWINVWISILKARFILRSGVWWCIGICHFIFILDEPWLLNRDRIDINVVGVNFMRDFSMSSLMTTSSMGGTRK